MLTRVIATERRLLTDRVSADTALRPEPAVKPRPTKGSRGNAHSECTYFRRPENKRSSPHQARILARGSGDKDARRIGELASAFIHGKRESSTRLSVPKRSIAFRQLALFCAPRLRVAHAAYGPRNTHGAPPIAPQVQREGRRHRAEFGHAKVVQCIDVHTRLKRHLGSTDSQEKCPGMSIFGSSGAKHPQYEDFRAERRRDTDSRWCTMQSWQTAKLRACPGCPPFPHYGEAGR